MRLRGFTLIEVLVSTGIFTVVMVIALGALLAMVESDRKAQTLKTVINNLNFALDSMSRSIRTGEGYNCGSPSGGDCKDDDPAPSYFAFTAADGRKVAYCLRNGAIVRLGPTDNALVSCGGTFAPITSAEVVIEKLAFILVGSARGDGIQPKVTILISGYVQAGGGTATLESCKALASKCSVFNLQTSVTQRIYDQ